MNKSVRHDWLTERQKGRGGREIAKQKVQNFGKHEGKKEMRRGKEENWEGWGGRKKGRAWGEAGVGKREALGCLLQKEGVVSNGGGGYESIALLRDQLEKNGTLT